MAHMACHRLFLQFEKKISKHMRIDKIPYEIYDNGITRRRIFHVNILKFEQKNPNMLRFLNMTLMRRDL